MSTGVVSPTLNGFSVPPATQNSEPFNAAGLAYTVAEPQVASTIGVAPYPGLGKLPRVINCTVASYCGSRLA